MWSDCLLDLGPDLNSSSFLLFHSGQVFHELVCPFTVLPYIFFNFTALFSYPDGRKEDLKLKT